MHEMDYKDFVGETDLVLVLKEAAAWIEEEGGSIHITDLIVSNQDGATWSVRVYYWYTW
jgi:hypothetical protein